MKQEEKFWQEWSSLFPEDNDDYNKFEE